VRRRERDVGRCRLVLERNESGDPVGRLVGEIDLFNAHELAELVRPLQDAPGVMLDLDSITFVDLEGARALVALSATPDGVQFVASPDSPCGRLLGWLAPFAGGRPRQDNGAS
jgi:STAS domain